MEEASGKGHADVVKVLLEHGADPSQKKHDLVRTASWNGHTEVRINEAHASPISPMHRSCDAEGSPLLAWPTCLIWQVVRALLDAPPSADNPQWANPPTPRESFEVRHAIEDS